MIFSTDAVGSATSWVYRSLTFPTVNEETLARKGAPVLPSMVKESVPRVATYSGVITFGTPGALATSCSEAATRFPLLS